MLAEKNINISREEENSRFIFSFLPGTLFVMLLWLICLLTYLTGVNIGWLGVLPRNIFGLIGILTGPLIHADLIHLLSNSFPFVLLSGFILFQEKKEGVSILLFIYFLSGLFTWFIGRQSYHIGASGVIYGMAGYLLFKGFFGRDRGALAVSLAVLFLYSGLFYGLFPGEERVSWEGHLSGLIAGLLAAFTFSSSTTDKKTNEPATEPEAPVAQQQQHTSHTLENATTPYFMQYSLSDKTVPETFTYSVTTKKHPLTK